jgi:hypothetical protein
MHALRRYLAVFFRFSTTKARMTVLFTTLGIAVVCFGVYVVVMVRMPVACGVSSAPVHHDSDIAAASHTM